MPDGSHAELVTNRLIKLAASKGDDVSVEANGRSYRFLRSDNAWMVLVKTTTGTGKAMIFEKAVEHDAARPRFEELFSVVAHGWTPSPYPSPGTALQADQFISDAGEIERRLGEPVAPDRSQGRSLDL